MGTKRKVSLVTGSTDGIGKQTALGLAAKGYDVLVTGRSSSKGEEMLTALRKINPSGNFRFYPVDFSSQESTKEFCSKINQEITHLSVLVNNVGLLTSDRKESVDGTEMMLAVNYLSPFLVTHLLLDKMKISDGARIVNVIGGAYKFGKVNFDDINLRKNFSFFKALSQAKLAKALFSLEAEKRWSKFGVHSIAVDPGAAKTPGHNEHLIYLLKWLLPLIGISTTEAAFSSIQAASSQTFQNRGGLFLNKKGKEVPSTRSSRDEDLALKLWVMSSNSLNLKLKNLY